MNLILTVATLGVSLSGTAGPSNPSEMPANTSGTPSAFFWGDFDADGLADAFVVGEGPARLLRNLGDGRFTDVTDRSGLTLAGAGSRAHMGLWADYDGDGRLDLYLPARTGASHLMRQAGDGTFEVASQHAGLPEELRPSSAQWLDYDADGRPDLGVVNDGVERLFHNVGEGLFEEIDLGVEPRPFMPGFLALDREHTVEAGTAATPEGATPTGLPTSSAMATGSIDPEPFCAGRIKDVATGQCLRASSVPTAGMLYPLGNELFIDSAGYVGLSTLTPGAKLDVVGGDIRTDGQLVSTAASGAPLSVASTDVVPNLNADRLDGFDAASFSMLGNSIGNAELENDSVDGNKLQANAVQSVHIFPNTINSLDIASGGVLSDEIQDGTILDVDVSPLAAIAGTKISANFGTQTVQSNGASSDPAFKGVGVNGPTNGYLGVQGITDFDGIVDADWLGREIGAAGISVGSSTADNYGVSGLSTYVGVSGEATSSGIAGVLGTNASTSGTAYGVVGEMSDPTSSGTGVRGVAPFYGVLGETTSDGVGVLGLTTTSGVGVYGRGRDGVIGDSQNATGSGNGVMGTSLSTAGIGVRGAALATAGTTYGVYGTSDSTTGRGVYGIATTSTGINYGVFGQSNSTSGRGVRGEALATSGVNYGVQGRTHSPAGWGVISYGSSGATGQKNFIQPHPSDPSKELHFFYLEGTESGTYFRGTDHTVGGLAVIDVPEEFRLATAAEDLSAQLTPVGAPARMWIESQDLDQLVVRSDMDVKFHFTVNGVRRGFEVVDVVAENRSFVPDELGVPFGTQYPESYRNLLVQNGILNPDYTPNEATAAQMGWTLTAPAAAVVAEDELPALERARERQVEGTFSNSVESVDLD